MTDNKNVLNVYNYNNGTVVVCDDRLETRGVYYRMGGRWRTNPDGWHFRDGTTALPALTEMFTKDCTAFTIHTPSEEKLDPSDSSDEKNRCVCDDESEYSGTEDCPGGVCPVGGPQSESSADQEPLEEEDEDEDEDDESASDSSEEDCDSVQSSDDETDCSSAPLQVETVHQLCRQTRVLRRIENILVLFGVILISAAVSAGLALRR